MYHPEKDVHQIVAENEALRKELDAQIPEREKLRAENAELHCRLKEAEREIYHMKVQLDMVHLIFGRRNYQ